MTVQPERRKYKRINNFVEVRYFYGGNTHPVSVFAEDISSGGIRLQNPFPIEERFRFPMEILLDKATNLSVKAIGRVVWQRMKEDGTTWQMGIEFVQIPDSDKSIVEGYLEKLPVH